MITTMPGSELWLSVSGRRHWRTFQQAGRVAATREREALATPSGLGPGGGTVPWPRWPWYALFLSGVGLLWLVERIGGEV